MQSLSDTFYYDETSPSCLRWARDSVSGNGNIELIVLPICEDKTGERLVKIGDSYFDAYQLTRILKTLKGE